ncbi:MAG: hypothetical protein ACWGMZ_08210, partial [Thermoguttaceae bacterium]
QDKGLDGVGPDDGHQAAGFMLQKMPQAERSRLEAKIAALDPLRFAAALKKKGDKGDILMINAAEDEVIPRDCTQKLAAALGLEDRVVWLPGLGHYTAFAEFSRTLNLLADFFSRDLPAGAKAPTVSRDDSAPLQIIACVLRQMAVMLDANPDNGRCHKIDLVITFQSNSQQSHKVRSRLIVGSEKKFSLFCKLPNGGVISAGQNERPWLATGNKEVFEGSDNPNAMLKSPLELLDSRQVKLLRMLSGMLKVAATMPEVLQSLVVVKDDGEINGSRAIRLVWRTNPTVFARLLLKKGNSPLHGPAEPEEYALQNLTFNFPGVQGNIKFVAWQVNGLAKDALFQAPADLPRRKVDNGFLYTLFSTAIKLTFVSAK